MSCQGYGTSNSNFLVSAVLKKAVNLHMSRQCCNKEAVDGCIALQLWGSYLAHEAAIAAARGPRKEPEVVSNCLQPPAGGHKGGEAELQDDEASRAAAPLQASTPDA